MDCKSKRAIDKKKLDDVIAYLEWIPPHFALYYKNLVAKENEEQSNGESV